MRGFIFSILFFSVGASATTYEIRGAHSERGSYQGTLQIQNGVVTRDITYDHYQFKGRVVEEIWTGKFVGQTASFSLEPSQALTTFEGFTFSKDVFAKPQVLNVTIAPSVDFQSTYVGHYSEKLKPLQTGSQPWLDETYVVDVTGSERPFAVAIAQTLAINSIIGKYRKLSEVQPWSSRAEFKDAKQYAIVDHTDYDFYRKNPQTIRVTNRFISPLSLAEATQKRNAFANSLSQKENFFDLQASSLNLNSAGLLETAQLNHESQQKVSGVEENDSALWTATYALSQVLRYEQTKDESAYQNAKKAIKGVVSLVDVVPDETQFARTLMVSSSREKWDSDWTQGTGGYSQFKWKKGGNNDMFKGVALAFVLAHRVLRPSETALIAKIKRLAPRLSKLAVVKSKDFNESLAVGAQVLWNDQPEAATWVSIETAIGNQFGLTAGFYIGGISDWSGNHLNLISTLTQIITAQEILKEFSASTNALKVLKKNQAVLHNIWQTMHQARLGYITLLDYAFGDPTLFDDAFRKDVQESLWVLREIPAPRTVGAGSADLTLRGDFALSAYPLAPWKSILKQVKFDDHKQSAYAYPLYEFMSWGSNYIWKDNPFTTEVHTDVDQVTFSGDYLLVYWSSRTSGLVRPED